MTEDAPQLDPAAAQTRLQAVKDKRGYLLAHHGLLALTAPELLAGYDACYTALTLGDRHLAERDKEFVWLGVLAVMKEHLATQHVKKFLAAGGHPEHITLSVRMAAYAHGADTFEFAERYWTGHVPGYVAKEQYLEGLDALCGSIEIEKGMLHLGMAAIHTSIRGWQALKWHIQEAYALEIPEVHLAEAISYAMFTGSIPNFIEGCDVWRSMIINKEIKATEPFRLWAATEQDGPG